MLKQQPRILTATESAFAAKHFTQVYSFLNENNLSEDDYYDSAINGFLKAVQKYNTSAAFGDFKEFAEACMKAECAAYKEKLSRTPTVLSISDCYNSANELEDTIADVKNTMDEAISSICLEETMQCFDATQQRIVHLLMDGYSRMDIAAMLHMSVTALFDEIRLIQNKAMASPLMAAV